VLQSENRSSLARGALPSVLPRCSGAGGLLLLGSPGSPALKRFSGWETLQVCPPGLLTRSLGTRLKKTSRQFQPLKTF